MTIATAIQNAQGKVANAYTAISNKGGTLPATQDLSNMPTAISSIPSGITPSGTINITSNGTHDVSTYATADVNVSKYGATIDNFFRDNGTQVQQSNFATVDIVLPDTITSILSRAFSYKFYYTSGPKSFSAPSVTAVYSKAFEYCFYQSLVTTFVDFSVLKTISSSQPFRNAFSFSGITSAGFSELETISGASVFESAWYGNKLNSINFPKLKTISGNDVFSQAFAASNASNSAYLTSANFPLLDDISGRGIFLNAFAKRLNLSSLSFPALKTTSFGSNIDQFNGMFSSDTGSTATGGCTVHFPSNLQSTVSGLTGYPTFGGTSGYVTLAFDLPATS